MLEKPSSPEAIRLWRGSIPVSHRYTAGVAGERFFRALADRGVFLATRCGACQVVYCPARAFCERCLAALEEELEVGPRGRLESFTIVRRGLDGRPLAAPVTVGLVRLDGADTVLVHRIGGDSGHLQIGITVEPVLRDASQRQGCLDDVEHFRPLVKPPPGRPRGDRAAPPA
ncbi:MAG TPA: Zn-ribbon domain-containing OB-fold protein [Actinomycetota bacterium]|nr:Zn-ribbon domain-containing OB-fold protein [Actinomycetota bacterium]